MRARKQFALKHHATYAGLGQVGAHGGSGRSPANNRDIEIRLGDNQRFRPRFFDRFFDYESVMINAPPCRQR
jgi:hypothetical protein